MVNNQDSKDSWNEKLLKELRGKENESYKEFREEYERFRKELKKSSSLTRIINPFLTVAIGFHNLVNSLAQGIYYGIIPPRISAKPEEARSGMHKFCQRIEEVFSPHKRGELETSHSTLEEKLNSEGDYYLLWEELKEQPHFVLWNAALRYDQKGIIPAPQETLEDFVYRGNALLFAHKSLRELFLEPEIKVRRDAPLEEKVQVYVVPGMSGRVKLIDLKEANAKIPYYMDLTWAVAYVKDKKKFLAPALGITFTFPQYNGINFMHMLSEYKSREQFLGVLAHEMAHMGTVHLDSRRDYLETKAYHVSKGDLMLGEYAVALSASPRAWIQIVDLVFSFIGLPVPDRYVKLIPKIKSGIEVMLRTHSYREVQQRLEAHYGVRGGYILGRLNADEIEEFRDTNDIHGRIALKDDLKWRIMKENFAKLE